MLEEHFYENVESIKEKDNEYEVPHSNNKQGAQSEQEDMYEDVAAPVPAGNFGFYLHLLLFVAQRVLELELRDF